MDLVGVGLDDDIQGWLAMMPVAVERDPEMARDPGREAGDDVLHRGRPHVDAPHQQHVVGPSDADHPRTGPAALAPVAADLDVVPGPEAHQRPALSVQVREHQLSSRRAAADVHNGTAVGVDDLRQDHVRHQEVVSRLHLALTRMDRDHVPVAHRLGDRRVPCLLERGPHGRDASTWLRAHQDLLQAEHGRVRSMLGDDVIGDVRGV